MDISTLNPFDLHTQFGAFVQMRKLPDTIEMQKAFYAGVGIMIGLILTPGIDPKNLRDLSNQIQTLFEEDNKKIIEDFISKMKAGEIEKP